MKAMIVDDEAPARSELKFLLDELGQTEVVAEAASVREAIEKLKEYPCDVMFLDVNMPEATGLQLAEALQHLKFPPAVVFVTAYSEFALDGFKVNAIDYLVKPVETERLSQAISRVREHVSLHVQAQKSERIPVEKGGKKILIGIDKIRFVMARDDYAYLQTDTDRYFSTVSLAQLEKRLDGHGFFRVHRGYLVNLSMVEEIESVSGGTLLLTLNLALGLLNRMAPQLSVFVIGFPLTLTVGISLMAALMPLIAPFCERLFSEIFNLLADIVSEMPGK